MTSIKLHRLLITEYKKVLKAKNRINKQLLYKTDKEKAFEGLFLYSVTVFENYIEELFLWILKWKYSPKYASWIKLNKDIVFSQKISDKKIKKIILWDKNGSYIDWLPYNDRTIKRSKKYFIDWKPFSQLSQINLDNLQKISELRNYIAHKSKESKNIFTKSYTFEISNLHSFFAKPHSWYNDYFDNFIIELNAISWSLQKWFKE